MSENLTLAGLVLLWYATSGVCNETSKHLVKPTDGSDPTFDKLTLTLAQLTISAVCGFVLIAVAGFVPMTGIKSLNQLLLTVCAKFPFPTHQNKAP
jgi:hypothetical protein